MKRIQTIVMLCLLSIPLTMSAQGRGRGMKGGDMKEIQEIRKNVFARVLVLTDAEAQKFWPVFDQMQAEMDALHDKMMKERRNVHDNYATLTDAELDKSMQTTMDLEEQILAVKRKYYTEFKKVLPLKKVALIPHAEREFKKELIEKIRGPRDMDE